MAKPIKRNEHIVALSKDHHFTLLFCWKIRNGLKLNAAPIRIKEYVAYFWQYHMKPHFLEEETILFALLKDDKVQKALNEHTEITQQVQAIIYSPNPLAEQLVKLADSVDNHVRYEERDLFPYLETALTLHQLEKVGAQLAADHNPALKDDFEDEFWLKASNAST